MAKEAGQAEEGSEELVSDVHERIAGALQEL